MAQATVLRSAWTWLGVCLAVIIGLNLLVAGRGAAPPPLAAGSGRADGALALNLWLHRIGFTVQQSDGSPAVAADQTLMLLQPGADTDRASTGQILAGVRRGGRVVIASEDDAAVNLLAALHVSVVPASEDFVQIVQPLLVAPPASSVQAIAGNVIAPGAPGVTVARTQLGPVVQRIAIGRGVVWVLTTRQLLDNAHLPLDQNRNLLLNMVRGSRVIQLNTHQPATAALAGGDWLTGSVWGVFVLFLVFLLFVFRWLSGWRLGPALVPLNEQHRAGVEYVRSLAGLIQRSGDTRAVLGRYQSWLTITVRRRYGIEPSELTANPRGQRVAALLAPPAKMSEREMVRLATAVLHEEDALGDEDD